MIKHNPVTGSLVEELKLIVGGGNVLADPEAMASYSRDETPHIEPHLPEVVVKPGDTAEVARVLVLANKAVVPVTPRGGGTGLNGGAVPIFGGIVMSLERMNRIKEIDEANFVAVVEPGVPLVELYRAVEDCGLYYPVYPGEKSAFIGGNVATNAGGMRAVKYGVTRSFVQGLEAVLPTGEIIRAGGKFVKCSTGYDLTQLIVGSEGTLAVVTEVTLRLIPPPGSQEVLFIPFIDLHQAIRAVPEILKQRTSIAGLEFMEKDAIRYIEEYTERALPFHEHGAFLLAILEDDTQEEVYQAASRVAEVCAQYGSVDVYVPPSERAKRELMESREKLGPAMRRHGAEELADVVVPRSRIVDFVTLVKEISRRYEIPIVAFGHAGDGNVHLYPLREGMDAKKWEARLPRVMEEIYRGGASLGGMISGEHGLGFKKTAYLPLTMSREQIALMSRLKTAFDPNHILNPGKVFDAG